MKMKEFQDIWSEVHIHGCKTTEQVDQRQHILLTQLIERSIALSLFYITH